MHTKGITVKEAIAELEKCNPDSYIFFDDNGVGLEIVEIADANYCSYLEDGTPVNVVYLIYRGQIEESEKMRAFMKEHLSKK